MKIEDCKTVPEFFGVNIHDHIWVEGKRFKVYRDALGGEQSAPNEASRALVGCLTGQLKWSKHEPMTADEEFGSCTGCGYEFNSELISEYEIEHCPKCGRKIEEIIVPAMTVDEEKILREIAAWLPKSDDLLTLYPNGNIRASYRGKYETAPFGSRDDGSKAYEVLLPILEKHGEINLDDYRENE